MKEESLTINGYCATSENLDCNVYINKNNIISDGTCVNYIEPNPIYTKENICKKENICCLIKDKKYKEKLNAQKRLSELSRAKPGTAYYDKFSKYKTIILTNS